MGLVSWFSFPSHVSELLFHWDITWRTVDICVTLVVNDHVQNLKWIVINVVLSREIFSQCYKDCKSHTHEISYVRGKDAVTLSIRHEVEIVVSSGRVEVLNVLVSASECAWMHKMCYHDQILIGFGEKLISLQEFKVWWDFAHVEWLHVSDIEFFKKIETNSRCSNNISSESVRRKDIVQELCYMMDKSWEFEYPETYVQTWKIAPIL